MSDTTTENEKKIHRESVFIIWNGQRHTHTCKTSVICLMNFFLHHQHRLCQTKYCNIYCLVSYSNNTHRDTH